MVTGRPVRVNRLLSHTRASPWPSLPSPKWARMGPSKVQRAGLPRPSPAVKVPISLRPWEGARTTQLRVARAPRCAGWTGTAGPR